MVGKIRRTRLSGREKRKGIASALGIKKPKDKAVRRRKGQVRCLLMES